MTTAYAALAGRIAGTAYAHARRTISLIDWAEVGSIVLHGLQILIVLTLLAGRYTRRAWDTLLQLSEAMGKAYAAWIAPAPQVLASPAKQPIPAINPLLLIADDLASLTRRELQALTGCRRKLSKAQLVAIAIAY